MKKPESNPTKTALIISVGFIIIYLITEAKWALFVSLTAGLVGSFSDYLSRKLDFVWMKLGWLLGLIVPNIILGLVFYAFLFPISLISKLFGKTDHLSLRNTKETMFITTNKSFDKSSFEKPW